MANTITRDEYKAARKTMLHAMQYLRQSYSCFDNNSIEAYNLAVGGVEVAYQSAKQYR